MPDFKDRYVLGKGYPILDDDLDAVGLDDAAGIPIALDFPIEQCFGRDTSPVYHLVLERVDLGDGVVQFKLSVRADDGHKLSEYELVQFADELTGIAVALGLGICLT